MYIGRFVVIAADWAGYRVSSRSFPNRAIIEREGSLAVVPTGDEQPDNPYVSYTCLRQIDTGAVIGNGSHVDPIAEKIDLGYPPRDAIAHGLLTLDYEKDDYDTPRIAGVIGTESTIGIVRHDALIVHTVDEPTLVATYELDEPTSIDIDGPDPDTIARSLFDLEYDHPVCSAAVTIDDTDIRTAIYNGPDIESPE